MENELLPIYKLIGAQNAYNKKPSDDTCDLLQDSNSDYIIDPKRQTEKNFKIIYLTNEALLLLLPYKFSLCLKTKITTRHASNSGEDRY